MSGRLLPGVALLRPKHSKARHRRIRRLELRADDSEADRAQLRKDVREIRACLLILGVSPEAAVPPELTCAVMSGSAGPVTLDVDGQTVIAGLDPGRPGDVIEIWRAIKGVAGTEQAS